MSSEGNPKISSDGLRKNLRRKRSAWCKPAGERSARSLAIWGIGLSTLVRWMSWSWGSACCRPNDGGRERCHGRAETATPQMSDPPRGAGHPEEGDGFFPPGGKSMRFELIDTAKAEFPIHRLCDVLSVSQSGYFAWKGLPGVPPSTR